MALQGFIISTTRAFRSDLLPRCLLISEDFLSSAEHDAIVRLIDTTLIRRRYGNSHWDSVIESYKETELGDSSSWPPELCNVIARAQNAIDQKIGKQLKYLPPHVVDLSPKGYIGTLL